MEGLESKGHLIELVEETGYREGLRFPMSPEYKSTLLTVFKVMKENVIGGENESRKTISII